jgi:hypothetical protein
MSQWTERCKTPFYRCLDRTGNDSQISHNNINAANADHKAFDPELHGAVDFMGFHNPKRQ